MSYRPPYYKMYPQDYLSSATTRGMTLAEHGVYRKLLDHAWLEEPTATLPADLTILAKLTGIDRRILCKFTVKYRGLFRELAEDSQRIYNPRQMAEYQEFLQTCEKKRLAGIESGRARQTQRTSVQQTLNNLKSKKSEKEEEKKKPSANAVGDLPVADGFEEFYKAYPKHVGRDVARRAWRKVKPEEKDAILARVELNKIGEWAGKEKQYIPNPASWLNGRRWEDEILGASTNGKLTGDALTTANLKAAGFVQ